MSQHFYGYGQNQGQPPSQQPSTPYQQPQPQLQPPAGYGVPTYNNGSYEQAHPSPYGNMATDNHRSVSQSSYDYNASRIPGLGITGTPIAPASSPFTAPPGINPWGPGSGSQPIQFSPNAPPYSQAPPTLQSTPSARLAPASAIQKPGLAALSPPQVAQKKPQDDDMEEGELSEGQFEDLYEPKDAPAPTPTQPVVQNKSLEQQPKAATASAPAQSMTTAEDAEPDLYGDEEEEGEITADNEVPTAGSYSSFVAASEVRNNPNQRVTDGNQNRASTSKDSSLLPSQAGKTVKARAGLPGLGLHHAATNPIAMSGNTAVPPSKTSRPGPGEEAGSLRSFAQAKKEAQEAVLRLFPLGVQYQNYIDEGFEERIVKDIFTELNLNITNKLAEPAKSLPTSTEQSLTSSSLAPPTSTSQPEEKGPSPSMGKTGKPEARNERIARLLAEQQAKKAATAASKPQQPPPARDPKPKLGETGATASTPTKPKVPGDKNLLLQQKMAALREMRGSRGAQSPKPQDQKAAAPLSAQQPSSSAGNASPKPPTGPRFSPPRAPAADRMNSHNPRAQKASLPEASTRPAQAQPSQLRSPPAPSVPSLASLPASQPASINGRKRPVAADFDDYSSTVGPLKRPYVQDRHEISLVIDVSDGSDDEDMEIDSDGDSPQDTPPEPALNASAHKSVSIRDFPPLTDTLNRPFHSHGSSTPNGTDTKRKIELELKEKAIQEMKQKIAQAEAQAKQKAGKSSSGSQTPNQTATTPDLKEPETGLPPLRRVVSANNLATASPVPAQSNKDPSSKLPKPSQLARLRDRARVERRGRIVSLDLPRVDGALRDKISRLQELRDEKAVLQAEIDKGKAERKVLIDELAQLDTESPSSMSQSSSTDMDKNADNLPDGPAAHTTALSPEIQEEIETSNPSESPDSVSSSDISMETGSPGESAYDRSVLHPEPVDVDGDSSSTSGMPNDDSSRAAATPSNEPQQGLSPNDARLIARAEEVAAQASEHALDQSPVQGPSNPPAHDESQVPGSNGVDIPSVSASEEDSAPADSDHTSSEDQAANREASRADQISSVTAPREAAQEIETEVSGESGAGQASQPSSIFVPYKSPLSHFRAYRFHPDYQSAVQGGLKSLTYSNKINPALEMCPYELDGRPCPEGTECKFQHFRSILAPDDQILLELGKSDGYEDKGRFIHGLRELLHNFRANKVKDFGTIAQGIIDYRAQFLGDKSKVLNLEGVVL